MVYTSHIMKIDIELNPRVKDFIEKKNPRIIGLWWAMYWRFFIILVGASIALSILLVVFTALMGGNK